MKPLILIVTIFFLVPVFASAEQTERLCQSLGGTMVDTLQCPNSKKVRDGRFCLVRHEPLVYFNGCTKVGGKYGSTFYKPCLKHDFCYHHEPATNNLSKKKCDRRFYEDMVDVCAAKGATEGFLKCSGVAWAFYQAVKVGGKNSWQCSNSFFDYSDLDKIILSLK